MENPKKTDLSRKSSAKKIFNNKSTQLIFEKLTNLKKYNKDFAFGRKLQTYLQEFFSDQMLKENLEISTENKNLALFESPVKKDKKSDISLQMKTESPFSLKQKKSDVFLYMHQSIKPSPDLFLQNESENDTIDSFDFHIFKFPNINDKHKVVWNIFQRQNYFNEYQINLEKFCEFIDVVQRKYNKRANSFHNYEHGISGHTGRTNAFEVNSQSKLSIIYHDKSVLEQYHAALTFKILKKKETEIFENVSSEKFKEIRKNIVNNILATDMKEHFVLCESFEKNIKELCDKKQPFGKNENERKLLLGMLIHCSDFNGTTKQFSISKTWSERINTEFNNQYKEELILGIPVTPYFANLDKISVMSKAESGFIKVIVLPLWSIMNNFLENSLEIPVKNLENNLKEWEKIAEDSNKKLEISPEIKKD